MIYIKFIHVLESKNIEITERRHMASPEGPQNPVMKSCVWTCSSLCQLVCFLSLGWYYFCRYASNFIMNRTILMICLRFLALLDVYVHDQYPCPSVSVSMFMSVSIPMSKFTLASWGQNGCFCLETRFRVGRLPHDDNMSSFFLQYSIQYRR